MGLVERHLKRLKGEQLPGIYPFRIIDKVGETKWVEINVVRIEWEGNPATLNFLTDITERKQAEEKLLKSNRRLEETLAELQETQQQIVYQERLRALGEMASGIAHDFNNVLTPITAYSDLLLRFPEDLDDKQRVIESLKIINTASQDAANIISRLHHFYRHREENETFTPIHLNPLIEQCIALTQPKWKNQAQAAGKSITVSTNLQEIVPIAGVESELREVLTNLIFNATDAIATHGTITLRTQRDKNYGVIEVVDEGIGMTEEVKRRCFDPFFTTKRDGGTGLGLSVIYGIIQRHKGNITVDSTPGVGTTFRICLPIHEVKSKQSHLPVEDVVIQKQHILVVDDDSAIRQAMMDLLTADGHTVETAISGREGLEKFRGGGFDLVITDRAMPDINGDQLATFIKQLDKNTPVIMLTGFGQMMQVDGEYPSGVDIIIG